MTTIQFRDIINEALGGPEGGAADFTLENGAMQTNVSWGVIPEGTREALADAMTPLVEARDQVAAALVEARRSGDAEQEAALQGELAKIAGALTDAKQAIEAFNGVDDNLGSVINESGIGGNALDDVLASIQGFATAGFHAAANEVFGASGSGESFMATVAPTGSAVVAQGTTSAGSMRADDIFGMMAEPEKLVASFESDPKGFFDALKDMSSEDRQGVIMTLQNEIQAENQLFSTLSNFVKAMHDSQKAVIANLRV